MTYAALKYVKALLAAPCPHFRSAQHLVGHNYLHICLSCVLLDLCECACMHMFVCVNLRKPGLVVQYAEDAMWSRRDQLQTGVEVLEWH